MMSSHGFEGFHNVYLLKLMVFRIQLSQVSLTHFRKIQKLLWLKHQKSKFILN
jgi:hypothetical protein